jgi:hypothetical protein
MSAVSAPPERIRERDEEYRMNRLSAMEWRRIGLAGGLLPLLLALPAGAQQQGRLNVLLEGEAGVRDDGNYGQQQAPDLRQDRTLGRAGFDLQLSYALERLNLALGYSPYYERSLDRSHLSGTTHRLDFGLVGDLNRRLQLNVREQLLSTPDVDLYAPVTTSQTTVVTQRGNQLSNLLDVSLNQTFSRHASLIFGVNHSLRRYQDPALSDDVTLGARLGAGFELARGSRIEAALSASRYDYKERGLSDARTLGVAYATDLGADNHLRVEAGAYSVDSQLRQIDGPATLERQSDTGWRGGFQFAHDRRLFHWSLGANHDISPGAGLGRAVTADNAFLGVSTAVGRSVTLGLDGNVSRQRDLPHQGQANTSLPNNSLTEFAAGTARVGWSFAPAFRLEGGYSRIWQRSRVEPLANLSYARYYVNLAFRIYNSGKTPVLPGNLGRPNSEKSDNQ